MAELLIPVHPVVASTALSGDRDVTGILKVAQDHVRSPFGDANRFGNVPDSGVWIPAHLHQDMAVI